MHPLPGETSNESSYSSSFNSYFNTDLAQIAARVTTEFTQHDDSELQWPEAPSNTTNTHSVNNNSDAQNRKELDFSDREIGDNDINNRNDNNNDDKDGEDDDNSEFEFDLTNLVPADGEIGLIYPVFNRDLLRVGFDLAADQRDSRPLDSDESSGVQVQLKNLFLEENSDTHRRSSFSSSSSSSSDSEADGLESIPPGTYSLWTSVKSPSPSRCTKSSSTGLASSSSTAPAAKSKAWKLRDLLRRSKSDGKEGVMLITSSSSNKKKAKKVETARGSGDSSGGGAMRQKKAPGKGVAARGCYECYYCHHGKKGREGDNNNSSNNSIRRRTYLPYKRNLVGFFVSRQGLRKMSLPPF